MLICYIDMFINVHMHLNIYIYLHMLRCMYIYIGTYTHVHMCIYIYICTMDLYVLFERLHVERVLVKLYLFLENPY